MARLPPPPSANFLASLRGSVPSFVQSSGDINELSRPPTAALGSELPQSKISSSIDNRRRSALVDSSAPKWAQKRQMRQQERQHIQQPEQRPLQNGHPIENMSSADTFPHFVQDQRGGSSNVNKSIPLSQPRPIPPQGVSVPLYTPQPEFTDFAQVPSQSLHPSSQAPPKDTFTQPSEEMFLPHSLSTRPNSSFVQTPQDLQENQLSRANSLTMPSVGPIAPSPYSYFDDAFPLAEPSESDNGAELTTNAATGPSRHPEADLQYVAPTDLNAGANSQVPHHPSVSRHPSQTSSQSSNAESFPTTPVLVAASSHSLDKYFDTPVKNTSTTSIATQSHSIPEVLSDHPADPVEPPNDNHFQEHLHAAELGPQKIEELGPYSEVSGQTTWQPSSESLFPSQTEFVPQSESQSEARFPVESSEVEASNDNLNQGMHEHPFHSVEEVQHAQFQHEFSEMHAIVPNESIIEDGPPTQFPPDTLHVAPVLDSSVSSLNPEQNREEKAPSHQVQGIAEELLQETTVQEQHDRDSSRRDSLGLSESRGAESTTEPQRSIVSPTTVAPVRRSSVDFDAPGQEQIPAKTSKWAQRAALRKQGHSRRPSLPGPLEPAAPTLLPATEQPLLEPLVPLISEALSPTGVAIETLPIDPRNTPHHRTSPNNKIAPLPPSSSLPPSSVGHTNSNQVTNVLPNSLPSSSFQTRRASLPSDPQARRFSHPSSPALTLPSSLPDHNILPSQETKTSKKRTIGPLPNSFDYSILTPAVVKERIRKRNYPVPFPIFCAVWTKFDNILIGGGGGQPGTGVSSGALICDIKKELPDLKSQRYDNGWSIFPQAELDTCDYLFCKMAHHPNTNEIVGAVGSRVYRFLVNGRVLESSNFVQTDFSAEVVNQLTLCVRFSRNGDRIVTGGEDRRVRVFSYPDLRLVRSLGAHSAGVISVDFSSDSRRIASVTGDQKHSCIRVWDVEQGSDQRDGVGVDQGLVKEIRHKLGKQDMEFAACQWALERSSECLLALMNATARGPGYLGKFDATSFKLLKLQKIDACPLGNMELSSDRQHVVLANNEGCLWVFDVKSFKCLNSQKNCHDLPCTSLAWSPDGTMICSASADKSVVFLPRQGPPPKSVLVSYLLLLFHVLVVLFIYLILCPDPLEPWDFAKEEL